MILRIVQIMNFILVCSVYAQSIDPYKFFPSAIGNKWRWYSNLMPSTFDEEITKDSLTKTGSRFIFLNNSNSPRYMIDTLCQVWQVGTDKPELWYKLKGQQDDSYEVSENENIYTVKVTLSTASAFGENVPAKIFTWYKDTLYPSYAIHMLVYGVGLYSSVSLEYGFNEQVTGYIIDGMRYGTLTSVDRIRVEFPLKFSLEQNYPNPFNPTTIIRFSINDDSYINLCLYDILGREIKYILNGNMTKGYYQIPLSCTDLSSGIYFLKLQAKECIQTKKIILYK